MTTLVFYQSYIKKVLRGTVYSTTPCKEFSRVLLRDSQHILEMEAKRSKKEILYEEEDIVGLMKLWKGGKVS